METKISKYRQQHNPLRIFLIRGDGVSAIGGSESFVVGNRGGAGLISSPIGGASSSAVAEAMPLDPRLRRHACGLEWH